MLMQEVEGSAKVVGNLADKPYTNEVRIETERDLGCRGGGPPLDPFHFLS